MTRLHRLKKQKASKAQKPRSIVTDGLIIAGATAAIYLLTFAFEYGYCAYFGVPGFLIEPSTGTILFAALSILVASVLLIEASRLPRELLAKIPWPRLRARLLIAVLMWGIPALVGGPFGWLLIFTLGITTLTLLSDYVFALAYRSGSFSERIAQGEKNIGTSKSPWDGPTNTFGTRAVGLTLIVSYAVLIAWVAGAIRARFQEGYIVLKSSLTPPKTQVKRAPAVMPEPVFAIFESLRIFSLIVRTNFH